MPSVRAYIDGFNLYHAIEATGLVELKWLNLRRLCENMLRAGEQLDEVHFFTAVWRYDQAKQQRHMNFLAAQQAVGVIPHEGNFNKPKKYCHSHDRYCPFREEKQTDVGIAVKMAHDALTAGLGRMILITADSDQIPTAKLIRGLENGPSLTLAFPPGRAKEARDLGNHIPDRFEISVGRMKACPLPRSVTLNGVVVATMPALYAGEG